MKNLAKIQNLLKFNKRPSGDPVAMLKDAFALLDTPSKWCQNHVHANKDREQHRNAIDGPIPARFCSFGALNWVRDNYTQKAYRIADVSLDIASGIENYIEYNDTTGRKHSEVKRMWKKAIEIAGEGCE